MYHRKDTDDFPLILYKTADLTDQRSSQPKKTRVQQPEKHGHDQRKHEHGNGGLRRFLPGRPNDLANLDARPLDKMPKPLALGTHHAYRNTGARAAEHHQDPERQRQLEFVEVIRIQTADDDSRSYQQFDDVQDSALTCFCMCGHSVLINIAIALPEAL